MEETAIDPKKELLQLQKNKINEYYNSVLKRLETEVNILFRYELKIELESILKTYSLLFVED